MAEQTKKMTPEVTMSLVVLVAAATVMILNETSLSVALPAVMADFGIPATSAQWLTTGFMLTMAVVIPTTGFLIERFSTRQIFVASVLLFMAGTTLAALAPTFLVLLAGRVIQASGTALAMPLLMTVTMTLVPPQRRGTIMGIISVVISVAPALGPTVGGLILDRFSWHFIFWFMLPLGLLILALGVAKLPNVGETRETPLDVPSVVLSVFAFGGLVYGLSSIEQMLAGNATVPVVVTVVGVVSLVFFVRRQLALAKDSRALLDLRPFTIRNYTIAVVIMLLAMGLLLGSVTVLPIYLQTSLGVTAMTAGLVVMPGGLLQGLLSPIIGRIFDSVGPRPLMIPGALAMAVSIWLLSLLGEDAALWKVVAIYMLFAVSVGFMMTPLMTTSLASLPQELYSHGSAILTTLQQLAGATGTALLIVVLTRGTQLGEESGLGEAAATAQGASWAFMVGGTLAVVAAAMTPLVKRVRVDAEETAPVAPGDA
ncbi:MDR family MFS transporter [Corynebacterium incognita]|nr:MDR family MFS transporter [Corynebacterium incognita]